MADVIENFTEIRVETPVDRIIKQIRSLISSGQLSSGEKLPAERKLAERLGVSRMHVRDAIRKLEFYGILKTLPQSGTVVAGMGTIALKGLISDVLKLEKRDFSSLVETRLILEAQAASLAAERRSAEDLINMREALDAYKAKTKAGAIAVEEDLIFHLAIAEASKNSVLKSLMMIITPDIVNSFINFKVCEELSEFKAFHEHEEILTHITNGDGEAAAAAMKNHLSDVMEFSRAQQKTDQ